MANCTARCRPVLLAAVLVTLTSPGATWMTLQRAYAPMHPEFDRFLFASVGEEAEATGAAPSPCQKNIGGLALNVEHTWVSSSRQRCLTAWARKRGSHRSKPALDAPCKKPPVGAGGFSAEANLGAGSYFGCCWVSVLMGAALLLESCSRSFFSRLISTRPPEMRFVFAVSSLEGSGALPIPTR